ncbi:hypothetical protein CACET_c33370 [Clostridium aceticum]|uniref:Uncharacterized protein n=1 Tax=Clostridium aceticum TaxID=84022 RepID=A0A0G3WDL1_9CLOT|nr:hypothetical protein [Clostridium aceticum]AKL96781.1 hypothetical protein CACET_c33370 [Clostridium aceticum]
MVRKMFWLAAYVATGVSMMGAGVVRSENTLNVVILLAAAIFFVIALTGHFKELSK